MFYSTVVSLKSNMLIYNYFYISDLQHIPTNVANVNILPISCKSFYQYLKIPKNTKRYGNKETKQCSVIVRNVKCFGFHVNYYAVISDL